MPAKAIRDDWSAKPASEHLDDWLYTTSDRYRVSSTALKWRLVALGLLPKDQVQDLHERKRPNSVIPHLFSSRFMERMAWGIKAGEISVRRLAEILGMDIPELKKLFPAHGIAVPFDL